mmetsp:Transcript_20750/g.49042  ORF Transcript_20750/g.49042 Transcript_20750/m.49042 type:complete len:213 (+) Transcript_20750:401-1039(+)
MHLSVLEAERHRPCISWLDQFLGRRADRDSMQRQQPPTEHPIGSAVSSPPTRSSRGGGLLSFLLGFPVLHGGLDGVFRQHRAVELDGRELQVGGDVRVLDRQNLVHALSLDPLGGHGGRGDRRTAPEGLEDGLDDVPVVVDLDLQLHDVSARRSPHEASSDRGLVFVHRAYVSGIFVVFNDILVVVSLVQNRSNRWSCNGSSALKDPRSSYS